MENAGSFDASDREYRDFFEGKIRFRIPRFQRPYSWDEDHAADFWSDLTGDEGTNFIGSFVFNNEHKATEKFVDVIDGQQRLLTTAIFAAAIRDFFRDELGSQSQADLVHRHNIVFEDEDGTQHVKIRVGDSARQFFSENIQRKDANALESNPKSIEERRIRKNYEFFRGKLRAYAGKFDNREEQISKVMDLLTKLKDNKVIEIKICSEEDAFEIFETVNARGVELSVADLLKNVVFKKITESGGTTLEEVDAEWTGMMEDIDGTGFDVRRFIRYFWISSRDFVSNKSLFKSVKRNTTDFRDLLDELEIAADTLVVLTNPNEEQLKEAFGGYAGRITRSLKGLTLMRITQCYVFLLALFQQKKVISSKRMMKVVKAIESFSFTYTLIGKGPGNRVEKMYSRHALKLQKAARIPEPSARQQELDSVLDQLLAEMKRYQPAEDQFMKSFMELKYGTGPKARQIVKYVLNGINASLSSGEQHPDFEMVNIEHLLPQKLHPDWDVSKAEAKEHVHLLGNLTIVSKQINSKAGNASLGGKLKELEGSELPITKALVQQIKGGGEPYVWGGKEIRARQEDLGKLAYREVWSL